MLRLALVVALLFMPCVAAAQSSTAKVPRVGILANTIPLAELASGSTTHPAPRAVIDGLRNLGWIDGRNVRIVWRSAEGRLERLPDLAEELLREPVDVLVGYGPGVDPLIRKTSSVPIVMATSGVTGREIVDGKIRIDSLARPGETSRGSRSPSGGKSTASAWNCSSAPRRA
jgi:putative ABC transport system substrate-binding protein